MVVLMGLTDFVAARAVILGCSEKEVCAWLVEGRVLWFVEAPNQRPLERLFSFGRRALELWMAGDRR